MSQFNSLIVPLYLDSCEGDRFQSLADAYPSLCPAIQAYSTLNLTCNQFLERHPVLDRSFTQNIFSEVSR